MTNKFRDRAALMAMQGMDETLEALNRITETIDWENEYKGYENDVQTIREALQSMQWRPISEAKYGQECLLFSESGRIKIGQPRRFCDGQVKACYTHFMPIPPAPQGGE